MQLHFDVQLHFASGNAIALWVQIPPGNHETRIRRCLDGKWTVLWTEVLVAAEALRKKRASKSSSEDSVKAAQQSARRVVRLLAKKGLSKAARELCSDGLRELTFDTLERVKQLHPPSEPPRVPANSEVCSWPRKRRTWSF